MRMNEFIPDVLNVLTDAGWINASNYNPQSSILVMDKNFKLEYLKPKIFSYYNYKGPLIEIITTSGIFYCKPNVSLLTNGEACKAKNIKRGNLLNRFDMWSKVETVSTGEWEGKMTAFFFGEEVYMPVKYNRDYCLLIS